jgi:hypothetical protein
MTGNSAEDPRVQAAVQRHAWRRAFEEAEKTISITLPGSQVQQLRAQVEAAQPQLGLELRARLQTSLLSICGCIGGSLECKLPG